MYALLQSFEDQKLSPFNPSAPFPWLSTYTPELIVNEYTWAFRKAAQSLVLSWAPILGGQLYGAAHALTACTPLPPLLPLSIWVLSLNTIFVAVTLHGTSNSYDVQRYNVMKWCLSIVSIGIHDVVGYRYKT